MDKPPDIMNKSQFAKFVAASGLSNLADGIVTVAWAWLASLLTRDPLLIAIVPVARRLPWLLFAVPAGIVADRMDRRILVLRMDIVRLVSFSAVALAVWLALPLGPAPDTGVSNPGLFAAIMISAIIVGVAEVFRDNASQTMLPTMVPHHSLERANGRLWAVELSGQALIGPALGAFLIGVSLFLPFAVNAVILFAAALMTWQLSGSFMPGKRESRDWRVELKEGFLFLKGIPLMRTMAWLTGVWNLLFQMMFIGLVLHVQENLGLSAEEFGLVLAVGAVGGIAGGWTGEYIIRTLGSMRAAQWMLACSAPAFFAIAFAPNGVSLAIFFAIFEFTGFVWNTVSVSYRQRTIPDHLLGRVNSLYRLLAWGMMPVGLVLSGLVVRVAEGFLTREQALMAPFLVASAGALLLVLAGWKPLESGFRKAEADANKDS